MYIEIIEKCPKHWDFDEIKDIKLDYSLEDIKDIDLYLFMNLLYTAYSKIFEDDIDLYIKYIESFIDTSDLDDKIIIYFN